MFGFQLQVKRQTPQMFSYRLGQWSAVSATFSDVLHCITYSLFDVQCTRTCGGGLRTRSVVCADQDGEFSTSTSGCGNPTGTNRPACIDLCNQIDCTTREQIHCDVISKEFLVTKYVSLHIVYIPHKRNMLELAIRAV